MKAIFFGMPGAGKGTQAQIIASQKGVPHISTGDMLRSELKNKTELGENAKAFMDKGELVPDEIMIKMIEKLFESGRASKGFIFDGFPRTVDQARALDQMIEKYKQSVETVFNLVVSEEMVFKRILGRYSCSKCGKLYNKYFSPSKKEGICDKCNNNSFKQREDDNEKTVRSRLDVYNKLTSPVLSYYQKKGIVKNIDSEKSMEEVTKDILSIS